MSSAALSTVKAVTASRARVLVGRAPAGGQPSTKPGQSRPRLQVLPGRVETSKRIPFLVSCIAVLCVGLIALLGLNIGLSHGAYEVYQLQKQQQQLAESTQHLQEDLSTVSSPAVLSSRARALGMVPSGAPVFIQLSDGRIIGDTKEAGAQASAPFADLSQSSSANPKAAARETAALARAYSGYRAMERVALGAAGTALNPADTKNTNNSNKTNPSRPGTGIGDGAIAGN